MSDVETISVALTREQIADISAAIEAGEYASPADVIREAMRDWQAKRALGADEVTRLRRLWDVGKASGDAGEVDFDELRREARNRLQAAKRHPCE